MHLGMRHVQSAETLMQSNKKSLPLQSSDNKSNTYDLQEIDTKVKMFDSNISTMQIKPESK